MSTSTRCCARSTGTSKQGASFGHAKIAGRALLRKGLSPQITTLSRRRGAGDRRGAAARRQAGSGRGAARQLKQAITTARSADPRTIMVRGDSAFGTKKVIGACLDEGSRVLPDPEPNKRITKAIEAIDDDAYTPVHYPGAVADPDTGALISDAEVAETPYTLRRGHGRTLTVRLVVRRVKDARYPDALFPVWRYHPFFTNSDLPTTEADITHRKHAIVETTFADLIDGPLAHIPSGLFAANCAWLACAVIAHNLLRAAGTLAGGDARRRPRRHPAPRPGQRARPLRRARPQADAAPARALALANRMENPVGQHHRLPDRATHEPADTTGFPCPPRHPGPTRGTHNEEKLVQASGSLMPQARPRRPQFSNPVTTARNHSSTDSGLSLNPWMGRWFDRRVNSENAF